MESLEVSKMAGLHLFCNPYSNCSARVMMAVAEKGLKVQLHLIDLLGGEQLTPEFRRINPTCDLPALVHDGNAMGDSISILRYLEQVFPERSLSPMEVEDKEEMDRLLDLACASHMEYVVPWIYAKGFGRLPTPEQKAFYDRYVPHRSHFHNERLAGNIAVDHKVYETSINDVFAQLEKRFAGRPFLLGNDISLADIAWFPTVYLLVRIFGLSISTYPYLEKWLSELEQRPAFVEGVKAHMKGIPFWLLRFVMRCIRLTGHRK